MRVIDVMHLGRPHVIGCWEVEGALVDPGPESSLGTLLAAIGEEEPRALLLTHIHLDHAAATGALVRRWPNLEVHVHERGAPHLAHPSKLIVPPTPPPDIDLEAWEESLDAVAAWSPTRLALTHFGAVEDDVPGHVERVKAKLREEAELARRMEREA